MSCYTSASGSGEEPRPKKLKPQTDALVLPEKTIKLLRESLLALDKVPYCFNLIKINKSNAEECVPFSKCFVQIERSSDKKQAARRTVYDFACIFMKGVEVLNVFLEDQKMVPAEKEVAIALQRLVQTTLKLEDIGEKLTKQMSFPEKNRETEWCITLVNHLLKELSVNQQYRVDMQSKVKVDACSCCNEYVYFDDCSLGNPKVWHGHADIFMGPHPDVVVHASSDTCNADVEGSFISSFEVEDSATLCNDISQIISETIVFAFLQKKDNPSFENYLIPTIGISKRDILFYLYDPEHDILLESAPFRIFESQWDSTLSYPTVLALWLILNYKTFCTGITEAMVDRHFTADFLLGVKSEIKTIYKEELQFRRCGTGPIKSGYKFMPQPGEGWETKKSKPVKKHRPFTYQ